MGTPSDHLQSRGWWADQIRHVIDRAKADGYHVQLGCDDSCDDHTPCLDLSIYDNLDSSFGIVIYGADDE